MRLKHRHDAPPRKRLSRRGERRLDLRGVVGVVVHHRHAPRLAHTLEPAPHPGELSERLDRGREARFTTELQRHGKRRGGVPHVVQSRHAQS